MLIVFIQFAFNCLRYFSMFSSKTSRDQIKGSTRFYRFHLTDSSNKKTENRHWTASHAKHNLRFLL